VIKASTLECSFAKAEHGFSNAAELAFCHLVAASACNSAASFSDSSKACDACITWQVPSFSETLGL